MRERESALVGTGFRVPCHREGLARGDPLWSSKRRDKLFAFPETRWIAASALGVPPRNDKEGELECFWVSLIRLQDEVDCRVGTMGAFSQWQEIVKFGKIIF